MQIRMDQLAVLTARRTLSATIFRLRIKAGNKLCVSYGKRQTSGTLRTQKQLRMACPVFEHRLYQVLLYFFLPDDITKLHGAKIVK